MWQQRKQLACQSLRLSQQSVLVYRGAWQAHAFTKKLLH